jgi:monoamine oxidase
MEKKFYTYAHVRNDTFTVFYIGKGTAMRAYSRYERNNLWHKIVKKHGYTVQIISYWDTEKEAFEHEKNLIKSHKESGVDLANFTDGGDGISGYRHTSAAKELASARLKALWADPEYQTKMREIRKAQATPDVKKRMSKSQKDRWDDETRAKHSDILKESYSSEEKRKMQADRNRAFRESESGKLAMSERSKRYWASKDSQTDEAKKKRSEAVKKSWETRKRAKNEIDK